MVDFLFPNYQETGSSVAMVIISIAFMLMLGFLMSRLTKKLKLPNVTAYILTGILIGPYCINMIPNQIVEGMDFLSDIALAFIAFSTGQFFRLSTLKKNGSKVVIITLFETMSASILVFVTSYFFLHLNIAFSVVFATLAATTAPTSTMMTIRQTKAKGDFVDTLLQVIALDDIFGLVAFSIAISIASASIAGKTISGLSILKPLALNIGIMAVGGLFGILLNVFLNGKNSKDNRLIITVAMLFGFCGICALVDISPLLGCMTMSTVYVNLSDDDKLFKQINYFSPPFLLLFYVRSGISFDLGGMINVSGAIGETPLIVISALYFVVRFIGKMAGAFTGSKIVGKPVETCKYLGFALTPQAGVSIGLAALGARSLGGAAGASLQTVILAAGIVYELVGPPLAKLSLHLAGAYSNKIEDIVEVSEVDEKGVKKSSLELLIERINSIQEELPEHTISEDELAFTSAAEEQYEMLSPVRTPRGLRHRN